MWYRLLQGTELLGLQAEATSPWVIKVDGLAVGSGISANAIGFPQWVAPVLVFFFPVQILPIGHRIAQSYSREQRKQRLRILSKEPGCPQFHTTPIELIKKGAPPARGRLLQGQTFWLVGPNM